MESVSQDKFIRQLNLLGLVLGHPGEYDTVELAVIFGCEEVTIKRDLKELRAQGIDIHSQRKRGTRVFGDISDQLLRVMLRQYLGLAVSKNMFDPAVQEVIDKHGHRAFALITQIQFAKDNCRLLSLKLKSDPHGQKMYLAPRMMYHGRTGWYLAAEHERCFVRISLDDISEIVITGDKFVPGLTSSAPVIIKSKVHTFGADEIVMIFTAWDKDDFSIGLDLLHMFPAERLHSGIFRVFVSERDLELLLLWILSRGDEISRVSPRHISERISSLAETIAKKYQAQSKSITD